MNVYLAKDANVKWIGHVKKGVLVLDLRDAFLAFESLDYDSDCDNRDHLENNEVKDGLLSPDDR